MRRRRRPIVSSATTTGRLIASVIGTCIGLNIIAGDQYVAIVMPSRVYRFEFARRGITPRMPGTYASCVRCLIARAYGRTCS